MKKFSPGKPEKRTGDVKGSNKMTSEEKKGHVKKGRPEFRRKPKKSQQEQREIEKLKASDYDKLDPRSITSFSQLPLSSLTKKGLEECGFDAPTDIQRESLPLSLRGRDILGAAKTGSGKTLAFLVPLLERLFSLKWSRMDGLGALVITPTRELAYQIFEQLRKVGNHHDFSAGLVIGGKDLHFESKRMAQCNIVICTPGRLLQHMDENPQFDASNLQLLILDEADRCLEMGFSEQMNAILANLPTDSRQTLLFSATQTRCIKDLARLSLKDPVYVSVHEHASKATPDELTENYVVCELDQKLDMLWSFIKSHRKKKILVFVQSCKQAKYFCDLFRRLRVPTQISALYGTLNQLRRMAIYKDFCDKESGVLVATDIAARGLDFPTVDWVYQMDCPEDWKAYNHRVGRTARNKAAGQALLVLLPSEEVSMIKQLKIHKFPIERIEVNPVKISSIQRKIEAILASDSELKDEAQRAFQSYLKSVFLLKDKTVFNVEAIKTDAFAASLGLSVAPRVRFLQRQLKAKANNALLKSKESVPSDKSIVGDEEKAPAPPTVKEKRTIIQFSDSEDEEADETDILTVKRVNHDLSDDGEQEDFSLAGDGNRKNKKILTKAAVAKRLLKKNILANKKVTFDNEGEVLEDSSLHKISKEGKLYEREEDDSVVGGGIDIQRAKEILKAEDAFDKQKEKGRVKEKHKEEKRKKKEAKDRRKNQAKDADNSDSSDSEPDLSWLPDPDQVYGKHSDKESDDENQEGGSKRKWKPPAKEKTPLKAKRRRKVQSEEEDAGDLEELPDDELLALKLLGKI